MSLHWRKPISLSFLVTINCKWFLVKLGEYVSTFSSPCWEFIWLEFCMFVHALVVSVNSYVYLYCFWKVPFPWSFYSTSDLLNPIWLLFFKDHWAFEQKVRSIFSVGPSALKTLTVCTFPSIGLFVNYDVL